MANLPPTIDEVYAQIIKSMEQLSLEDNIVAIMVTRERSLGIQNAISYACDVYTANKGNARKYVELGLKAIYDHSRCNDFLTASLRTYNLEFATFAYMTYNQDPEATRVLFEKFANSSSEYEKKFMIDDHTEDDKSAITNYCTHLLQLKQQNESTSFDPLISYAETHQQLETAYDILHQHNVSIPHLCVKLGKYLESVNNNSKAAEIYEEANEFDKALELYICIENWEKAVCTINRMNIHPDEKTQKLEALACRLGNMGIFDGAASIYATLKQYKEAISFLVQAYSFNEAMELSNTFHPEKKQFICDELNKYVTSLQDECTYSKKNIEELTSRVEVIWDRRITATLCYGTLESSSVTNEDVKIIRIIHDVITEMCKKKAEFDDVILTLHNFNEELKAINTENLFQDMLAAFRSCATRIWFPCTYVPQERIVATITAVKMNWNSMDKKYQSPPKIPTTL